MNIATPIEPDRLMRSMVDAFDWASTPLGPRHTWPAELETVVQQVLDSRFPKAVIWGEGLTTIYNDAFRPILGNKPEALGRSFADIWAEAWDGISGYAAAAFAGQATFIEDFPLVINRNGAPEQTWFTFCYSPLRLADGTVAGMMDTVIETTRTVEARQDLELANRELAHRLKNSLAIVQAIASQTLKAGCDEQSYASFAQRMEALDHAHTVLVKQNFAAGSLIRTVSDSLAPKANVARVDMSGEDCEIGSKSSMGMSMMLHELATNALKYGAFSNDTGRVAISWEKKDGVMQFEWRESGGPPVTAPSSTGFGSRLVRRGLGGASQGRTDYHADGVVFSIKVPMAELAR